jgi:hypothetical protein
MHSEGMLAGEMKAWAAGPGGRKPSHHCHRDSDETVFLEPLKAEASWLVSPLLHCSKQQSVIQQLLSRKGGTPLLYAPVDPAESLKFRRLQIVLT